MLAAGGCGGDVRLESLGVRRVGWDTLRIAPSFAGGSVFGGRVVPDSLTVLLSDGSGRTLYTGYARQPRRPLVVPVPDPLLGDEAPFVLDLCGHFERGGTVCEQEVLHASPKRLHADLRIDYPLGRDTDRLRYAVRWSREREQAQGRWHPVPVPRHLASRLVVFVRQYPTDAVKLDFTERSGTLDLSKAAGYDDFWMRLHDPLLRGDSVEVVVRLEGRVGERPDSVATLSRWVRAATRGEREHEVYAYADEALTRVLDRLETARDGRASVRIVGWRFDRLQRAYRIDLAISWSGGFLRMARFDLEGTLTVAEESRQAVLHARHLSPDMQRLWYDRVGGDRLAMGALSADWRAGYAD